MSGNFSFTVLVSSISIAALHALSNDDVTKSLFDVPNRLEEALRKVHEKLNAELERMRQRKLQLEAELVRLVNAIAEGQPSQSFMTAIGEREKELQAITNKLLEPEPGSLRATLDELRTFAVSRLNKIPRSCCIT